MYVLSVLGYLFMIFGIPGNWIGAGVALLYFFLAREYMSLPFLLMILGAAVAGELLENLLGVLGARKYGAGKKGMAAAFIGSLLGGIAGTAILPVVGTIIGVLAGSFLLTYAAEYLGEGRSSVDSGRAAKGAMIGKAAAFSLKYAMGLFILILLFISLF